jgi:hypothetical protein
VDHTTGVPVCSQELKARSFEAFEWKVGHADRFQGQELFPLVRLHEPLQGPGPWGPAPISMPAKPDTV